MAGGVVALAALWPAVAAAGADEAKVDREHPSTLRLPMFGFEAAGGVGWARERAEAPWRRVSEARGEVSYLGAEGLVLALHGRYAECARSYAMTAPTLPASAPPNAVTERRVSVGAFVGWDPLHSWVTPRRSRAGLLLIVGALDVDQFINPVAPFVGVEPGAGARAYLRVAGPLTLDAGGTYQWVTTFSSSAAVGRVARGQALGTSRYEARVTLALWRAVLAAGYAGETFDFEREETVSHSFLLGVSFDV